MVKDEVFAAYDGYCPICGSSDGTVIQGKDGKYRTMCRVINCPCYMPPAPAVGFDTVEDCRNPFETDYLKTESVTLAEYLGMEGSQ